MAKSFGNTWWGKQWLNSLAHIDFSNRLSRGQRYARNGSVKRLEIKGGSITASVQGSRPRPYKVSLAVEQFPSNGFASRRFVTLLLENPMIVASLLRHKLDPEVLDLAEKCGLKVFPTSWTDLDMRCSCPDYAVPCKHIAAVIYKVSEEIDNDPFLVFRLHGLDLAKELESRGLVADVKGQLQPKPIESVFDLLPASSAPQWTPALIDISALPALGPDLTTLLPDHPSFSLTKDFKEVYVKTLSSIAKYLKLRRRQITDAVTDDVQSAVPEAFAPDCDVSFDFDEQLRSRVTLASPTVGNETLNFTRFNIRLARVNTARGPVSQPWQAAMKRMLFFVCDAVEKGNIVPRIFSVDGGWVVKWTIPAIHAGLRQTADAVAAMVPDKAATYRGAKVKGVGYLLISEMIGDILSVVAETIPITDSLFRLFFMGQKQAFDGVGERGIPGAIHSWIDRLSINSTGTMVPEIIVDEDGEDGLGGFSATVAVAGVVASDPMRKMSLQELLANKRFAAKAMTIVNLLATSADYLPELGAYVGSRGREPMRFTPRSLVPFLFRAAPLVGLLGIKVVLPASLKEIIRPRASVNISACACDSDGKTFIRLDDMLQFDWQVALGDTFVTPDEFSRLMISSGELVRFKGRYIYADEADLRRLESQLAKAARFKPGEMLAIALAGEYEDAPVSLSPQAETLIERLRSLEPIAPPRTLRAELRPYQLRGYQWMIHNMQAGFGSIIADDMGLGKTLQVIAVLLWLKGQGKLDRRKALVIVPTGLLANWAAEFARFAPKLAVGIYHGPKRELDIYSKVDVILTSYGIARTDVVKLKKLKWTIMAIDEAQNIKNTSTAQTKAINSIVAGSRIAMSGTPVENRMSEYWSIMNFVNKGYLGTLKSFREKYVRPIEIEGNQAVVKQFRAVTAPFMMRRLKSDKSIIADLPDKIERDEYASLKAPQASLYKQTLNEAMREIEGITTDDHASLFKRQGLVLQMILALKQICNHPAQFLKTGQADPELSGKSMMLLDVVRSIIDSDEKVLVFTQFREMGDLLVNMIEKATGRQPLFLHGGCSVKKRAELVERFQTVRADQVFILSLKAAGTGLNLTAASNVIHYDLWWNPAVEAQATDRAYRIGQHSNVQVYRFITAGTFEERINDMINEKRKLSELTVESGEKWIGQLSNAELRRLFAL